MHNLHSMQRCDTCGRAQGDLLKPDLHAAGAAVLLSALVHGHSDDNPKYKFTKTDDGKPAVTSTARVDMLLRDKGMDPVPIIPMDRILGLLTVLGMQLNTHYMHLEEFKMCRELATDLFSILDNDDEQ
jgi:hypothetical protein